MGHIILTYHGIDGGDLFTNVKFNTFKLQIQMLKVKGFKFISLMESKVFKGKTVSIIFDDGLRSIIPACYFLNQNDIPYGISLISNMLTERNNDYLDIEDLHSFKNCSFFSHSCSHTDLTTLNTYECKLELELSKIKLENVLNRNIEVFVYPFGKYNSNVIKQTKKAGYISGLSVLPFHLSHNYDKFKTPRICVNNYITMKRFSFFLSKMGNFYLHLAYYKRAILNQNYLDK